MEQTFSQIYPPGFYFTEPHKLACFNIGNMTYFGQIITYIGETNKGQSYL